MIDVILGEGGDEIVGVVVVLVELLSQLMCSPLLFPSPCPPRRQTLRNNEKEEVEEINKMIFFFFF